jgi:hypothetical protein
MGNVSSRVNHDTKHVKAALHRDSYAIPMLLSLTTKQNSLAFRRVKHRRSQNSPDPLPLSLFGTLPYPPFRLRFLFSVSHPHSVTEPVNAIHSP